MVGGASGNNYATVIMAAKKVANEELTACRELANDESIVSISLPKRLSMRPGQIN